MIDCHVRIKKVPSSQNHSAKKETKMLLRGTTLLRTALCAGTHLSFLTRITRSALHTAGAATGFRQRTQRRVGNFQIPSHTTRRLSVRRRKSFYPRQRICTLWKVGPFYHGCQKLSRRLAHRQDETNSQVRGQNLPEFGRKTFLL